MCKSLLVHLLQGKTLRNNVAVINLKSIFDTVEQTVLCFYRVNAFVKNLFRLETIMKH